MTAPAMQVTMAGPEITVHLEGDQIMQVVEVATEAGMEVEITGTDNTGPATSATVTV